MSVFYFASKACQGVVWTFLLLFCSSCLAFAGSTPNTEHSNVTIVLGEKNAYYDEFSNTLDRLLSNANISHRVIDYSQAIPTSGLVVGVGIKAATALASSDAPAVINVLITKTSHEKLLREFPDRASSQSMSAIYLNQPVHRQAHLVTAIFPEKHNVGILYSGVSKELNEIRQVFKDHSLKLQEQQVDQIQTLPIALQELLLGRSEMLFALPETEIYNDLTIRNILLATYRRGIPLIGYSAGYVKAGALCAVFSTPTQIATQAARMIIKFNYTHSLPASQYPREFEVMVNTQVADSLGLQVEDAAAIHETIEQAVKEIP
jgi:ABC-type uncharacterized transport system substrate-binding protein